MLTTADFIAPTGRLQDGMFPGLTLTDLVTNWLAAAQTKATAEALNADLIEAAAREYVYHLAYSHVADRLAATPNSVSVTAAANISTTINQDRIGHFTRLAAEHLASYRAKIAAPSRQDIPRSKAVVTKAYF